MRFDNTNHKITPEDFKQWEPFYWMNHTRNNEYEIILSFINQNGYKVRDYVCNKGLTYEQAEKILATC